MGDAGEKAWRDVANYAGHYRVSSEGDVYSVKSKRKLKQVTGKDGYRRVILWKDGKPSNLLVHRLVIAAFRGAIPVGRQVHHIDHDKGNPRLANLQVVTPKENLHLAERTGRRKRIDGESNISAKLTEKDVRQIHKLRRDEIPVKDIAARFSISVRQTQKILRGDAWKHIFAEELHCHRNPKGKAWAEEEVARGGYHRPSPEDGQPTSGDLRRSGRQELGSCHPPQAEPH